MCKLIILCFERCLAYKNFEIFSADISKLLGLSLSLEIVFLRTWELVFSSLEVFRVLEVRKRSDEIVRFMKCLGTF